MSSELRRILLSAIFCTDNGSWSRGQEGRFLPLLFFSSLAPVCYFSKNQSANFSFRIVSVKHREDFELYLQRDMVGLSVIS